METDHLQVPFVTKSGLEVEVDEGMLYLLTLLKELGVETQYSCEDNMGTVYVLGTARTFLPLFWRINKMTRRGQLSPYASFVWKKMFKRGSQEIDLGIHNGPLDFNVRFVRQYRDGMNHWKRRIQVSTVYGIRVGLRWPTHDRNSVIYLFEQVAGK